MKGKDVYRMVRRNLATGGTPGHCMSFSAANRYNILAAVNVKGNGVNPLEYILLDKVRTNALIFLHFVRHLFCVGVLQRGDVFVLDNCSVYVQGDNSGLQETLVTGFDIFRGRAI